MRDLSNRPSLRIDANDRSASLLLYDVEKPAAVWRPGERATTSSARGRVIAEHRTAHVEIVIRSEIAWLRIRNQIHNPEIGLRIRPHGPCHRTVECHLTPVRAERHTIYIHRNRG